MKDRIAQIPKAYRAVYKKAMTGKSLRAAVNAFCLECVCWQRLEITNCTAKNCPLYNYRPYQDSKQNPRKEPFSGVESKNNDKGYIG